MSVTSLNVIRIIIAILETKIATGARIKRERRADLSRTYCTSTTCQLGIVRSKIVQYIWRTGPSTGYINSYCLFIAVCDIGQV